MRAPMKVTLDADNISLVRSGGDPMSYAEAKEIALLRLELRACWDRCDKSAGQLALARLTQVAGNDNELAAEVRRWTCRFAA